MNPQTAPPPPPSLNYKSVYQQQSRENSRHIVQVVTIAMDVFINIARVSSTRDTVPQVPNLIPDLFQVMLIYRDAGGAIFNKICALLQILSKIPQVSFIFRLFLGQCRLKPNHIGVKYYLWELGWGGRTAFCSIPL